ncbi:EF-P lysine aminoacylase EpmA [Alkalilimnicola sp. S0819]|uniref:EF-P lysine aminoacylase EpmA n=1 Tax=Alkalilimnicola sp. S0819 TaxID=2613922 RepID=UPI0012619D1E|nr:EF-P lysine aminoacylase EpmA [Alkalilimnicola sp. S0819]KAB7627835.1 EF-P lysine aminoacylase GenX [Alkalilimnicola sp. S0819]MPQ15467.1 EF-P lysine aminoacylase GenX [Alkalilimnicola sp. S0819]
MAVDWRPQASLEALRRRADALARIRAFFAERGVWEVETPLLAAAGSTDPQVESLVVHYDGPGAPAAGRLWLQTSPEFHMKRLLAAGAGSIYQIGKAFRRDECGRWHNPEFTLVEWYRPGFDQWRLMDEVAALACALLGERPVRHLSYREAFAEAGAPDPLEAGTDELRAYALGRGLVDEAFTLARDGWLDLIISQCISPALGRGELCFLHGFPASQAALARLDPEDTRTARRFELFIEGLEIANGFEELADSAEQARRFRAEAAARIDRGEDCPAVDERLLAALAHGLPDCSGVALGLDRLIALALGGDSLAQVMSFTLPNA